MNPVQAPGQHVVAQVQIVLLADGSVDAHTTAANRMVFLGMMESAKTDLDAELKKKAAAPAVEIAPPGLVSRLNGKG